MAKVGKGYDLSGDGNDDAWVRIVATTCRFLFEFFP